MFVQHLQVSIPIGFSNALRRKTGYRVKEAQTLFQSLLGFLMRCDVADRCPHTLNEKFQSLLGFLMRCDWCSGVSCEREFLFQSLLGFLMRCDQIVGGCGNVINVVSIPIGFSNALRHQALHHGHCQHNPFQSLLGFLMRCDRYSSIRRLSMTMFQSLLGFLMRCDVRAPGTKKSNARFQSLLGFLMRCDVGRSRSFQGILICFNPYWVF